jgi:uncharacterized protein YhfF
MLCTVRRLGNTPAMSERLLGLIAAGQKTGLFSLPADPELRDRAPEAGDFVIFTDFAGRPGCLVRMEECRLIGFRDVGPELTRCETPAAREVSAWRRIHQRYWTPMLASWGMEFSEEMPVWYQKFRLLYPPLRGPTASQ